MTKETIKNIILAEIETNKKDFAEFELLLSASEKNKGRINRRLLKHLPEGCDFITKYNLYHIKFPSGKEHLLGWVGTTKELTKESLIYSDSCYSTGAPERVKKLEGLLTPDRFSILCDAFNEVEKNIKGLFSAVEFIIDKELDSYHNPVYYELMTLAGVNEEMRRAL